MLNKINTHIAYNRLIPSTQYGFRPGVNTETQITDLVIKITESFNYSPICVDLIFIDFSNAFDSVSHSILLNKLYNMGIRGTFIKLLGSFLDNRKAYVKYNSTKSKLMEINSGTPQGSKISPTLYSLYVSDLVEAVNNSNLYQFADDSVIVKVIKNESDQLLLQSDLNNIFNWCKSNNLKINPSKSVHMRFSLIKTNKTEYEINGVPIETKDHHKHLGVIIDNKMTFNLNTESIVNKALKKWSMVKRICKSVNGALFLKLYKTYFAIIGIL